MSPNAKGLFSFIKHDSNIYNEYIPWYYLGDRCEGCHLPCCCGNTHTLLQNTPQVDEWLRLLSRVSPV